MLIGFFHVGWNLALPSRNRWIQGLVLEVEVIVRRECRDELRLDGMGLMRFVVILVLILLLLASPERVLLVYIISSLTWR